MSGVSFLGTSEPTTSTICHLHLSQYGAIITMFSFMACSGSRGDIKGEVAFLESDLNQVEEIAAEQVSTDWLGAKTYFHPKSPEVGM